MSNVTTKTLKNSSALYSKSLLIAIAALALSATGAQAFSGDALVQAGLTDSQVAAFVEARELREEGDPKAARDVLIGAGIDETIIERVRSVLSKNHNHYHTAVMAAVAADDYQAFTTAIVGTPLADIITTKADFERFKDAHEAKAVGNKKHANDIFTELGLSRPTHKMTGHAREQRRDELTDSQKEAMKVALAANDHEAVEAIMEDAGIFKGGKRESAKFLRDGRKLD